MPAPEIRVSDTVPDTLALAGALVFATAAEAWRRADELLRVGHQDTLDLSGLSSVDSAGMACVLAVLAASRRAGRTLRVTHVPDDLAALARVCEVDRLL